MKGFLAWHSIALARFFSISRAEHGVSARNLEVAA